MLRVEPPGGSDYTWSLPPLVGGQSVFFAAINRGKKSVALDLRGPDGRDLLLALLETADVLLEGFKPGTLARSGLDPAELAERFPELVICSLSGYGQTGPLALEPGHDLNYQGLAGIVAADGRGGAWPVQVADLAGGALTAALAICASLVGRERGGGGQLLDISMTEGALALMAPHLAMASAEGRDLRPGGELLTGGMGSYRSYRCSDGRWLTVAPLEPKFWLRLCAQLDEPPSAPTAELLAPLFASRTRDAWVEALQDCCVGPALTASELPAHPQHQARGAFEHVLGLPMARAPFPWDSSTEVPVLGQHSLEVLGPLCPDLQALVDAGVVGVSG